MKMESIEVKKQLEDLNDLNFGREMFRIRRKKRITIRQLSKMTGIRAGRFTEMEQMVAIITPEERKKIIQALEG